ncbi:MAG TPA: hypothetical protein V6C65_04180 [Allocoleopsis sp.]
MESLITETIPGTLLPVSLKPLINRIAARIYRGHGFDAGEEIDLWNSAHPTEEAILSQAIAVLDAIDEYFVDLTGEGIEEAIQREK